ncbi:hypothetical protein Q5752_007000 [Cryptotrichosporon argae]
MIPHSPHTAPLFSCPPLQRPVSKEGRTALPARLPAIRLFSMDYLALLASRSVLLFSTPTSPPTSPTTDSAFASSPVTPTVAVSPKIHSAPLPGSPSLAPRAPLAPDPIAVPLHSILYADAHTAYHLTLHVLGSGAGAGEADPARVRAAERAVWAEIDKAQAFGRGLGAAWASRDVGEAEASRLAEYYGVRLADADAEATGRPHGAGQQCARGPTAGDGGAQQAASCSKAYACDVAVGVEISA